MSSATVWPMLNNFAYFMWIDNYGLQKGILNLQMFMKFNNGPRPTEQLKLTSIKVLEVPSASAVSLAVQLTATKGYHCVQCLCKGQICEFLLNLGYFLWFIYLSFIAFNLIELCHFVDLIYLNFLVCIYVHVFLCFHHVHLHLYLW